MNLRSAAKRLNTATLALTMLSFLTSGLLISSAHAQASPSVTSHGFSGNPTPHGVPPSVTSLGFGGRRAPGLPPSVSSLGFPGHTHTISEPPNLQHRHHRNPGFIPWGGAVYGVPYYPYDSYDDTAQAPVDNATDSEYQGGPTIFDRRGSGSGRAAEQDYRDDSSPAKAVTQAVPEPEVATNQPDTVLVFKDGHQLEIANYAIVGSTLFDLTDGHRRKIPLSELDLMATAKQNDDRGVDFRVPLGTEAN
ncbi:MAG TPA: hypothetical protein VFA74_02630 [Terriglobales bacterium]|nr:hypothetical protein [Terriglobales bacterium]